ncbi:hypothetical protein, partial [Pseudogemmobacter humi]|uniref:hypothetical protein n=1 Tax=Pseudogemmobacter humi TaxID=2483812 RepID=UPI001F180B14
ILNSRLNFRLVISTLQFLGHDLIFVSTKPAAAQCKVFGRPKAAMIADLQRIAGGQSARA